MSGVNMCKQIQKAILKREYEKNEVTRSIMIDHFNDQAKTIFGRELLGAIETTITRHLENYLPPDVAASQASSIMNSIDGEIVDALAQTTTQAAKVIDRNCNLTSATLSHIFNKYDKMCRDCGCIECAEEKELVHHG